MSALIDAYLTHLTVERRLAANSVESYARDLAVLAAPVGEIERELVVGGRNELERLPDAVGRLHEGTDASGTAISHDTLAAFTGFTADGTVKSLSVTGKIAAADKNSKPVGVYTDTVTITVGFIAK